MTFPFESVSLNKLPNRGEGTKRRYRKLVDDGEYRIVNTLVSATNTCHIMLYSSDVKHVADGLHCSRRSYVWSTREFSSIFMFCFTFRTKDNFLLWCGELHAYSYICWTVFDLYRDACSLRRGNFVLENFQLRGMKKIQSDTPFHLFFQF
jgi:hypothetical protein